MSPDFPSVDRNRLISNASKDLFAWRRPSTWQCNFRDGDNDFGFDAEIQVAPQGQVCYTFRAQFKGTESLSISNNRGGCGFSDTRIIDSLASNQEEQDHEQEKATAEIIR